MIPSSPKRMWTFLVLTFVAFYLPSWLVPAALQKSATYLLWNNLYLLALVVLGFWFGPALCRALVLRRIDDGALRERVDEALTTLRARESAGRLPVLPVLLFDHPASFVLTIGLLPGHCEVFLSSGLVQGLGKDGLHFVLARAMAHGKLSQRLAAVLPLLAFTLMPGMPETWREGLVWLVFLLAWLMLHWLFELLADRKVARSMGPRAEAGLREFLVAAASPLGWAALHVPVRWRLYLLRKA